MHPQWPELPAPDAPHCVTTPATTDLRRCYATGDWDSALEVVSTHWGELWHAMPPSFMHEVLAALPTEAFESHAGLTLLGAYVGSVPPEKLKPYLSDRWSNSPVEGQEWKASDRALLRMIQLRHQDRPVDALAALDATTDWTSLNQPVQVDSSQGRRAARLLEIAMTALLANDVARAKYLLRDVLDAPSVQRFPYVTRRAASLMALLHATEAEHDAAERWIHTAEQMPLTSSWVEPLADKNLSLARLAIALDRVDLGTIRAVLEEHPSPMSYGDGWARAVGTYVRAFVMLNTPHLAHSTWTEAELARKGNDRPQGWARLVHQLLPAWLALFNGDLDAATAHLGLPDQPQAAWLEALADYLVGQSADALVAARRARVEARTRIRSEMEVMALIAACHLARGDTEAMDEMLDELVRRSQATGVVSTFVYAPRPLREEFLKLDLPGHVLAILAAGGAPLSPAPLLSAPMTGTEADVMQQMTRGLSRAEIAVSLHLSENTVKTHLRNLYTKLGVTSREQALERAERIRMLLMRLPQAA